MYKIVIFILTVLLAANVNAEKLESIFVAPGVFITSKIKPSTEYESDRGNILYDSHELEKSRQYSIGQMLKDLSLIHISEPTRPY